MDYRLYDDIQARLGTVGSDFHSRAEAVLSQSGKNDDTVLIRLLCEEVERSLNQLAGLISDSLRAQIK